MSTVGETLDANQRRSAKEQRGFYLRHLHERLRDTIDVDLYSPPEAIDAALTQLSEELSAMADTIVLYRQRRNALLPVSRLLPNILVRVFASLAHDDPPCTAPWSSPLHEKIWEALGWIKVTQVCAAWRHLALTTPSLWNRIHNVVSPRWAIALLERSAPEPIIWRVKIRQHEASALDAAADALGTTHVQRLARLTVEFPSAHVPQGRLVKLLSSAPRLEELTISDASGGRTLPLSTNDVVLPLLRRLTLNHTLPPFWDISILHGLTHLELNLRNPTTELPPPRRPTLVQLLHILRACPQLASLVLTHILRAADMGPCPPEYTRAPLALPHLARLALTGDAAEHTALLAALRTAPARIALRSGNAGAGPMLAAHRAALACWLAPAPPRPLRALHLGLQRYGNAAGARFVLSASTSASESESALTPTPAEPPRERELDLTVAGAHDAHSWRVLLADSWRAVLTATLARLPPGMLQSLTLDGPLLSLLGVEGFRALILSPGVAGISELRLLYGADLPAAFPGLLDDVGEGTGNVLLPALGVLELLGAEMENPRVGMVLLEYIKRRRERGVPGLVRLVMRRCVGAAEWAERLRELVEDVRVVKE
ncbi:hypothetical protein DENSPDRAFT_868884 [Dentipellis sp. KUC8613]|nr:hypothetical protein DENSPDRAFT_868884 [Dentipellis sp. KUC8613]